MENQEQEVVQDWEVTKLPDPEAEKTIQLGKRYTTFEHYTGIRNFDILFFSADTEENKQYAGTCVETGEVVYFNAKGFDEYKEIGGCHNTLDLSTEREIPNESNI